MSWFAANWFGVFAVFAVPAALGILCWLVAHAIIGAAERHDREREARKYADLPISARRQDPRGQRRATSR